MVRSQYISNILDLLLDGDEEGLIARQQIPLLTDIKYDFTGSGVFVTFAHDHVIEEFKVRDASLILNGVKIETDEYPIEADATLFFKDGLVNFLEIWCFYGEYPTKDLTRYQLTQVWGDFKRKIVVT